jgi:hypothetical protein
MSPEPQTLIEQANELLKYACYLIEEKGGHFDMSIEAWNAPMPKVGIGVFHPKGSPVVRIYLITEDTFHHPHEELVKVEEQFFLDYPELRPR